MSRYNLIEEKWIPVRLLDGSRVELGIKDTLLRSKEIAEIEDPSPLVVAALHRFLLAVLYRALEGPTDIDQAKALFKNGLPGDKIDAYLKKWKDRFWLFDEKYPFGQVPDYQPKERNGKKEWRSWLAIAAEHNADNAKVLFDHVEIAAAGSIPTSNAARWLLACQTFALGGGNSDFVYTKGAPSANAVMVMPLGVNLHDTLIFNLVWEKKIVWDADSPIWEREPELVKSLEKGKARPVMGFVDLFTWQSRSIKINLNGNGDAVSELAFASGIECSSEDYVDPMFGYRIDEKNGKLPIQFRERGLWRDFDSLLPDESRLAPQVIEHAATLSRTTPQRYPRAVMVLGLSNSKAKIEFWRMERFTLPITLDSDRSVKTEIHQLLTKAKEVEGVLEKSLRAVAKLIIAKGDRGLQPDKWKAGKWIPGDISKFIGQCTFETVPIALSNYWSSLEPFFHDILHDYTLNRDYEDISFDWLKSVRYALKTAWEQHCATASAGDAWAIRAIVKAEGPILRMLKKLNDEIVRLDPKKEAL